MTDAERTSETSKPSLAICVAEYATTANALRCTIRSRYVNVSTLFLASRAAWTRGCARRRLRGEREARSLGLRPSKAKLEARVPTLGGSAPRLRACARARRASRKTGGANLPKHRERTPTRLGRQSKDNDTDMTPIRLHTEY